jgi:hypothetical protein
MPEKTSFDHGPVVSSREARSGVISGRILTVLIASFVLALILLGIATMWWTSAH